MRRISMFKRIFDLEHHVGDCNSCDKEIGNVSKPRQYYFLCAICNSKMCLECYENDPETKYSCPECD